jgi:Putative bacterial sensory transduction regulator
MSDIITQFTLDSLRESFQGAGYRVETLTDPVANVQYLRSATAGLGFDIRPGNRFLGAEEGFADVMLVAPLQVQGELPLDIVNRWNATRRFARLQLSPPFLMFCLDICVAGGVAPNNLRAQIEIWDRLVQELTGYLRDELARLGAARSAAVPPAQPSANAKLEGSAAIQ